MFELKIVNVINSEFAVSPEDGDSVFNLIKEKVDFKEKIVIDFSNIDIITTAFLNNAIGKLYIKKSHDKKYLALFCIYKINGIEVYC